MREQNKPYKKLAESGKNNQGEKIIIYIFYMLLRRKMDFFFPQIQVIVMTLNYLPYSLTVSSKRHCLFVTDLMLLIHSSFSSVVGAEIR